MATEVRDNPAQNRYELFVDDSLAGIADYYADGDVVTFPHTEIVTHMRGNGLGEVLVKGALDDVRSRNLKVRAHCRFVHDFIRDHSDYADLTAEAVAR